MRKLLALTFLLIGTLGLPQLAPTPAQASGYCSVTCPSGAVLQCCVSSGTCTSIPGTSIDCNGVPQSCDAVDCEHTCYANYFSCSNTCSTPLQCRWCERSYDNCVANCGPGVYENLGC